MRVIDCGAEPYPELEDGTELVYPEMEMLELDIEGQSLLPKKQKPKSISQLSVPTATVPMLSYSKAMFQIVSGAVSTLMTPEKPKRPPAPDDGIVNSFMSALMEPRVPD